MGLLSGNAAPLTLGVAGIVVSIACSWIFYCLGGRIARRQNVTLLKEINDLRRLLADYVHSMSERLGPADGEPGEQEASSTGSAADAMSHAEPNAAVEELVRASLGALVNERGEVDMSRLMREVSLAIGPNGLSAAYDSLRLLRARGVVEWDASDESLSDVRTIHVQPLRTAQEAWSSTDQPGTLGSDWVSSQ